jgi:hypothetical protein
MSVFAPPDGHPSVSDPFDPDFFRPRRVERRRRQRLRQRRNRIRIAAIASVAVLALGAWALFIRGGGPPPAPPKKAAPAPAIADPTAAWAVRVGDHLFVVVFSAPRGDLPVAVAIPEQTVVDVPGGGPTQMSGADQSVEMLIAATQATLERRVGHAVTSGQSDLAALIDDLGGVAVQLDEPTLVGDTELGPGSITMLGAQSIAYLESATGEDRTIRWEGLLQGLVDAPADPVAWASLAGTSHPGAAQVFAAAHGAEVVELPTVVDDLGTSTDMEGVADLVTTRFPPQVPLIRVVVLTGVGRPGVGVDIVRRIAPAGFWVVATQEAAERRVDATEVVAGDESFLSDAQTVHDLLGVGRVYVGTQPTGVADVTIVVGKDFIGG